MIMKNNVLSLVSLLVLSGLAYAGGNLVEAEHVPMVVDDTSYYVGVGLGQGDVKDDQSQEEMQSTTLMLQAGYQYNKYLAIEGRYILGLDMDYNRGLSNNIQDDYHGDFSAWGIYIKPSYPIGNFSLYALLGYGGVGLDNLTFGDAYEDGFQWGLGASYTFYENIIVFADYVKLYEDEGFDNRPILEDVDADIWNIGVSYNF